jgi:flagellar basal-body rod modification protein FlgD
MMISSTTSTTQPQSTTSTAGTTQTLGENDFLKLLTAQLQAQDPLNPTDSADFAAQLAQFSSVEQLTNINAQLTTMASSQASMQNTAAANLIGKTVVVTGDTVTLNGQASLNYTLPNNASKVTVSLYNSSGALVRTQVLGSESAGNNSYTWDGKDQNGNTLPSGQYTFAISAVNSSGQTVTATPLTSGTVTGIVYNNNVTYLTLDNNAQVQLGDIQEILGGS